MCNYDWSDFKTASAYYKKCGDTSKPKYDIKQFTKAMKSVEKALAELPVAVIYVGWKGVGTEAQYIFDEALNILRSDRKYAGIANPLKTFKIMFSENQLYWLARTGQIQLIMDYAFFKTPVEKKFVKECLAVVKRELEAVFGGPKHVKMEANSVKITV
jgi:hypothetical protein